MEGKEKKQPTQRQRKILVACLAALILIATGLTTAIFVINKTPENAEETTGETAETVDAIQKIAEGNLSPEELTKYIELSNTEIENAPDNKTKSDMYLNRAGSISNYLNYPDYDFKAQVLSDAHKSEELNPTAYTAFFLSQYEQNYGDEAIAQEYRKIADERGFNLEKLGGK